MKVLLVLYDGGKAAEEEPRLLGTIQNKLGIANWLKDQGHELVATADKEGEGSEFRKHIVDAEVLITSKLKWGNVIVVVRLTSSYSAIPKLHSTRDI